MTDYRKKGAITTKDIPNTGDEQDDRCDVYPTVSQRSVQSTDRCGSLFAV